MFNFNFNKKLFEKYFLDGFEEGDPIRYTKESLLAMMAEIRILAQCQFVVCTFSSNASLLKKIKKIYLKY